MSDQFSSVVPEPLGGFPPAVPGPKRRRLLHILCAAVAVGLVTLAAIYWVGRNADFHGRNYNLYKAMALYGTPGTVAEVDGYVQQIQKHEMLSHNEAEEVAIIFARANIAPGAWTTLAHSATTIAHLKRDGVIGPNP